MSIEDIYSCSNCNFKINQENEMFYYDSESGETIDYVLLMSTAGCDEGYETKGLIYNSYCSYCDRFVKVYCIGEGGGYNKAKQVYHGINVDCEIGHKLQELKDIKKREKYAVEKVDDSIYLVNFYEFENCGYLGVCESDFNEDEIIEKALKYFHKSIDDKINMYEHEKQLLYVVVDDENDIRCPECGNEIEKIITDKTPCPKCGEKIVLADTIFWD